MLKPAWAKWPAHPAERTGTYVSAPRRFTEAELVAADLARNKAKNSGSLLRDEIERAHRRELAEGAHQ